MISIYQVRCKIYSECENTKSRKYAKARLLDPYQASDLLYVGDKYFDIGNSTDMDIE